MKNKNRILIERIFTYVLNINPVVLDLKEDDDLDYAIYDFDIYGKDFNVDILKEFAWDYGIFKVDNEWKYSIMIHYSGDYFEPPSSDSKDSKESYKSFEKALEALVMTIMMEKYNSIVQEIMCTPEQEL